MGTQGLRRRAAPAVGGLVLLATVLYMAGAFSRGKIPPGRTPSPSGLAVPTHTDRAAREMQSTWYEAVGTIRSRAQATVSSQVTGRVVTVNVEAGDAVEVGTALARLEDRESEARLEQARSELDAARAERTQARASYTRIQKLFAQTAATLEQVEATESRAKQTEALAEAALQKLSEASASFGHTRIASPIAGVIEKRLIDPGDLAFSGKALFVIHHPEDLRLEANVREGLIDRIAIGQVVEVHLASLARTLSGRVSEIVPSADPVSRSFLVKVSLPELEGLYPGMFGKLRLSVGERFAILVPERAVFRVG